MDVNYRLQSVLREVLDDPALKLSAELSPENHNGWDSIATVQLILALESEFKLRLSTDEIVSIKSAGDIIKLLSKHNIQ